MLLSSFGAAECLGSRKCSIGISRRNREWLLTWKCKAFFGWLADRSSSRRTPLLQGLICNAAATLLLCFAKNIWLLLLSRFLQGLSSSVVYAVGLALLADTVGPKKIGQWMGYVISCLNAGMLVSPAIGGILYEKAGYYALFIVMFALLALDILLRLFMIEKKIAKQWQGVLNSNQNGLIAQYGTANPENSKVTSLQGISSTSLAREGLSGRNKDDGPFLTNSKNTGAQQSARSENEPARHLDEGNISRNEPQKHKATRLPLVTLLQSSRVLIDLYGVMITVTLLVTFDSALPLYVERTFGWGPTGGGLIFLAITLPILTAPLAGKLADQYGSHLLTAFFFLIGAVFAVLMTLVTQNNLQQIVLLCLLLSLFGWYYLLPHILKSPWLKSSIGYLTSFLGFASNLGSVPLGADLARAVESMEVEQPGIFGTSGAQAQVFSLYTSASAAGIFLGPAWTNFAYGEKGWKFFACSLGIISASAAVPLVCHAKRRIGLCG